MLHQSLASLTDLKQKYKTSYSEKLHDPSSVTRKWPKSCKLQIQACKGSIVPVIPKMCVLTLLPPYMAGAVSSAWNNQESLFHFQDPIKKLPLL